MKAQFLGRMTFILGLCSGVFGCASQVHIPAPVPLPLTGYTLAAPPATVWTASINALHQMGFANVAANATRGILATEEHHLDGNTINNRNSGVARFAIERDIYSEGQNRLYITLQSPKIAGQTEIRIAAELKGKVEQRGDIQYAPFKPVTQKAPDTDNEHLPTDVWETLTSNGVLEDRFLAALMDSLHTDKASDLLPNRSTP